MEVTINSDEFDIRYNPTEMSGKWESCTLMLANGKLKASPGDKRKRNTIKNADTAALKEAETYVAAKVAASANNNTPNNAYVPNTPEEAAAKAADRKAAIEKYGANLRQLWGMPKLSATRRQAKIKARMNLNATYAAINKRRTLKAPSAQANANAGLNRLAALPGLKAQHAPNSNMFKALNKEEKNLIMKHLGGRSRKNRK